MNLLKLLLGTICLLTVLGFVRAAKASREDV
jgi:hypothetical protein